MGRVCFSSSCLGGRRLGSATGRARPRPSPGCLSSIVDRTRAGATRRRLRGTPLSVLCRPGRGRVQRHGDVVSAVDAVGARRSAGRSRQIEGTHQGQIEGTHQRPRGQIEGQIEDTHQRPRSPLADRGHPPTSTKSVDLAHTHRHGSSASGFGVQFEDTHRHGRLGGVRGGVRRRFARRFARRLADTH